jgi:GT2 family glycosyltransferase
MLFDKSVIDKVGFWDESYFLYFEDADYCVRAKRKGIKLYYDPSINVWHKNAQSTGGSGSSIHVKYQKENRVKFGFKYAPLKTKFHLVKNFLFAKIKPRQ